MSKLDLKKVIVYLLGIIIFLVLIIIVKSIDEEKTIKKTIPTPENTEIVMKSLSPKKSIDDDIKTIINKSPLPENRYNSFTNSGVGYLRLAEAYRKAFTKAINDNDITEIELMLIPKSDVYEDVLTKIKKLRSEKIKMDLKSSELVSFSENKKRNGEIKLDVREKIGIKKDDKREFNYKDYNTKYTFLRKNHGLLIVDISDYFGE
jgi:hypothetical protein